jgi:hypothetical protein
MVGGYLLLLIPGILMSVWFLFIKYIFLLEQVHGFTSLYRSREYARGRWGEVAGKFIVMPLILGVIGILFYVLSLVFPLFDQKNIIVSILLGATTYIFSAILTPILAAIYTYIIYRYVRRPITGPAGKRTKFLIWGSGGVGAIFAVIIVIMLLFAGALLSKINPAQLLQQAQKSQQDLTVLEGDLAAYYNANGVYPESVVVAVPVSGTGELQAVIKGKISYQRLDAGKNYRLCLKGVPDSCIVTHHAGRGSPGREASASGAVRP